VQNTFNGGKSRQLSASSPPQHTLHLYEIFTSLSGLDLTEATMEKRPCFFKVAHKITFFGFMLKDRFQKLLKVF